MAHSPKAKQSVRDFVRSGFVLIGVLSLLTLSGCHPIDISIVNTIIGNRETNWFVYLVEPQPNKAEPRFLAYNFRDAWVTRTPVESPLLVMYFDDSEAAQSYFDLWPSLPIMSEAERSDILERIYPHFFAQYSRDNSKSIDEVTFFSNDKEHQIKETFRY